MKAIDYYKMYVREVENPNGDLIKLGNDIFQSMVTDLEHLTKARHVKTEKGFLKCVDEVNVKWNAFVRMLDEKYGGSHILKKDGFRKTVHEALFSTVDQAATHYEQLSRGAADGSAELKWVYI